MPGVGLPRRKSEGGAGGRAGVQEEGGEGFHLLWLNPFISYLGPRRKPYMHPVNKHHTTVWYPQPRYSASQSQDL